MDIDEEWNEFISGGGGNSIGYSHDSIVTNANNTTITTDTQKCDQIPIPSDIHVSTKTKITHFNNVFGISENAAINKDKNLIDLKQLFWNIPIIQYSAYDSGIIKICYRFASQTQEEIDDIQTKYELKTQQYMCKCDVVSHVDNTNNCVPENELLVKKKRRPKRQKVVFKDSRVIRIGISKKDLLCEKRVYRTKKNGSKKKTHREFMYCIVLCYRKWVDGKFNEYHVKFFNTGKFEIPGIQSDQTYDDVLKDVFYILFPVICDQPQLTIETKDVNIAYQNGITYNRVINVLINSNFNPG